MEKKLEIDNFYDQIRIYNVLYFSIAYIKYAFKIHIIIKFMYANWTECTIKIYNRIRIYNRISITMLN